METILSLAIVGAAVSLLVEYLKSKNGGGTRARVTLLVLSVVVGAAYYYGSMNIQFMQAVTGVLASASAFYVLIIKQLQA